MSESSFRLEVVTPSGKVYSGEITYFRAPGTDGQFGVLASHALFMTSLEIGLIEFHENGGARFIATSGGFIEVLPRMTTILAETAELKESIDSERAEAAAQRARNRLKSPTPDIDIERAQLALARALNRLQTLKK